MSDHGHELPFWQKYIFSTDHKVIGIQYGVTGLFWMFFGFCLMMAMRWSLAYPDTPIPMFGSILSFFLGEEAFPGGVMLPEMYNAFGAMHGTIMVFMGVVPMAVGAFGNYVMPLQIGAPDMAFPKLNMFSYWSLFIGTVIMGVSFFVPGGAANSGWTSYPPLANIATTGQTYWLVGMVFLITSSLLGSVNFIVTAINLRAEGLSFFRMPIFVWAQLTTSFLLLLAFPPLESAGIMQLMDRVFETSFFMPSGLVISGEPLDISGGGSPLLWQHLFWFLAHPEVYVLILPAMGIIAEIIANNTRKPLYGYKTIIYSFIFLGFMSFVVWAHHMYMTGMGTTISSFFQVTTMIISVPSVIILTCLLLSLWGGSIRFNVPMLFAIAFLPMFAIGGLTGLPLGLSSSDIHLHDTLYVIGHFHYVVAPGTIFALFAGVYYWFPKVTGRHFNDLLGKLHFWGTIICMNLIFFPMFIQGLAGMNRRMSDGGNYYAEPEIVSEGFYSHVQEVLHWNAVMSYAAWAMGIFQFFFFANMIHSLLKGKKVTDDNPWQATTLEWATPTPPPHGNFASPPTVYRDAYEYSVPGDEKDFTPQFVK
ncbi:cytochrome C oxidase subunit I [bacterium K02(2017)]|nr:cytochrome C oxidase subunit I [bacterium K02(2017)]